MKTSLYLIASVMLAANLGCAMCSHPYDYTYAAYDEAQLSGHRAGSAFAPYTTHTVVSEAAPIESEIEPGVTEEEVYYYESETP